MHIHVTHVHIPYSYYFSHTHTHTHAHMHTHMSPVIIETPVLASIVRSCITTKKSDMEVHLTLPKDVLSINMRSTAPGANYLSTEN